MSPTQRRFIIRRAVSDESITPKTTAPLSFANNASQKTSVFTTTKAQVAPVSSAAASAKPSSKTSKTTTRSSLISKANPPSTPVVLYTSPTSSPTARSTNSALAAGSDSGSGGISGGGIAGIVIGVLAVVAIIAFALVRRRRRNIREDQRNSRFFNTPSNVTPAIVHGYASNLQSPYSEKQNTISVSPYSIKQQQQQQTAISMPPATLQNNYNNINNQHTNQESMMYSNQSNFVTPIPITQEKAVSTPAPEETGAADVWQHPIGTFTVITTFMPSLNDELTILPGDRVKLFVEYDDGWCLGVNESRGNAQGVFPLHCIREPPQESRPNSSMAMTVPSVSDDHRLSKRGSSVLRQKE